MVTDILYTDICHKSATKKTNKMRNIQKPNFLQMKTCNILGKSI